MINIFKNQKGMDIVGQGGKIMLFTLPFLVAAILVQLNLPQIAALPASFDFIRPVGYLLLILGFILWGMAVFQLLRDFPKGKLVTTGAYGIVRNPIYSSVALLILPAVSLIFSTWVYFTVSIFMYSGVTIFISKEEKKLKEVFGREYEEYLAKVHRMIPYKKP